MKILKPKNLSMVWEAHKDLASENKEPNTGDRTPLLENCVLQ